MWMWVYEHTGECKEVIEGRILYSIRIKQWLGIHVLWIYTYTYIPCIYTCIYSTYKHIHSTQNNNANFVTIKKINKANYY